MNKVTYKRGILKFSLVICLGVILAFYLNAKSFLQSHEIFYDSQNAVPLSQLILNSDDEVLIPEGTVAYIDQSVEVKAIVVEGELHCDQYRSAGEIEIITEAIMVEGIFQCGTKGNRYKKKLIISLKHSDIDPNEDPYYRGLVVMHGGRLSLSGNSAQAGWTKLDKTANPGDTFVIVKGNNTIISRPISNNSLVKRNFMKKRIVQGGRVKKLANPAHANLVSRVNDRWRVGDRIAIGPTGYDYSEAEDFEIIHIDPTESNKLYLDHPVQYTHWGEMQTFPRKGKSSFKLDERAEVANLTRSIVIRADETYVPVSEGDAEEDQRGGHIMVHHMSSAYIDSVEFYKMGQAGVMARYPFHWHHVGDAPGQFVKNSSIHHSYQRCITVHRTNQTLLKNNVCYDFKGHGYFLEDGTEIENRIIKNLAIKAVAPSSNKFLLASDDVNRGQGHGRFPSVSGFWISHPNNYIRNNVASGSVGTGFWMAFEREIMNMAGNQVVATPVTSDTDSFDYNTAHAAQVGITWDGAPGTSSNNNPRNPGDKGLGNAHYSPQTVPVFRGLKAYKNYLTGIYLRGQTVVFKNAVVADNGWGFWNAYNQIVRDSYIIATTKNHTPEMDNFFYEENLTHPRRKTGVVMYDGPFEVHNTEFINFPIEEQTHVYVKPNGGTLNIDNTAVPFSQTGGTSKYVNFSSGLKFFPPPVLRMHVPDPLYGVEPSQGRNAIRDLDGTLAGTDSGKFIIASRSTGILEEDGCVEGPNYLRNFTVCDEQHTENNLGFMRWNGPAWGTKVLLIRSDDRVNFPIHKWFNFGGGTGAFVVNSLDYDYEMMVPGGKYITDNQYGIEARFHANTESNNPIMPVVKVVGYGTDCRLTEGGLETDSIEDLKEATQTSYYSNGDDFYVRIIPENPDDHLSPYPPAQATANDTEVRYKIACDPDKHVAPVVKGKIDSVIYSSTRTFISGWSCNFTKNTAIKVKLFAHGPMVSLPHVPGERSLRRGNKKSTKRSNDVGGNYFTHIETINSTAPSEARVAFNCGITRRLGRRFSFEIPNEELAQFTNHTFHVKGISKTEEPDDFLEGSGEYEVNGEIISHK